MPPKSANRLCGANILGAVTCTRAIVFFHVLYYSSPNNTVKICATNFKIEVRETTRATRPSPHPPPPPPPLRTKAKLRNCHVRHGSVLSLCILLKLLWFPSEKLVKVRNNFYALSEFHCCFLVLKYRRFLKANLNVQFDDQLEFYNVTV